MDEARFYDETSFLTLTYRDETLPAGGSLDLPAYQRFLKRLRKHLAPVRVRFFGCGEYGDRTERPHYHLVILGHAFLADRKHHSGTGSLKLYTSETLDKLWPDGFATIGSVTHDSAGYVARYVTKKVTGDREKVEAHYRGRTPEFMTCSKNLGLEYFRQFKADLYPDDFQVFKGRKMRVPRYYDKQLPEEYLATLKEQRMQRALARASNNTPDRLAVREEVTKARTSLYLTKEI